MITKIQAITSLVPNAQVTIRGDVIEWHSPSTAPVTKILSVFFIYTIL